MKESDLQKQEWFDYYQPLHSVKPASLSDKESSAVHNANRKLVSQPEEEDKSSSKLNQGQKEEREEKDTSSPYLSPPRAEEFLEDDVVSNSIPRASPGLPKDPIIIPKQEIDSSDMLMHSPGLMKEDWTGDWGSLPKAEQKQITLVRESTEIKMCYNAFRTKLEMVQESISQDHVSHPERLKIIGLAMHTIRYIKEHKSKSEFAQQFNDDNVILDFAKNYLKFILEPKYENYNYDGPQDGPGIDDPNCVEEQFSSTVKLRAASRGGYDSNHLFWDLF